MKKDEENNHGLVRAIMNVIMIVMASVCVVLCVKSSEYFLSFCWSLVVLVNVVSIVKIIKDTCKK